MDRDLGRQIGVGLATAGVLAVNALANALPLNGQTTGEISDRFVDFFTPAGYVFSIWGVIYVGLIAFTVFHSLTSSRWYDRMQRIGWLYVLSCGLNAAWIFAWHYNLYSLTLVIMLALLVTLILIYLRLNIGAVTPKPLERWMVDVPFSIYLGWISVATLANTTDVLADRGWMSGWVGPAWGIGMIVTAVLLGLAMTLIRTDAAFVLVLAWALAGVAAAEAGAPLVAGAAWIGAAATLGMAGFSIVWRLRRRQTAPA